MKKTLFLATALLGIMEAQAQNPFIRNSHPATKEKALLKSILRAQTPVTAQKPTGIHQRVVAQSMSSAGDFDSTIYKYNGPKGSSFDFGGLDYSYPTEFSFNYSPMPSFPGQVNPMNLLADTIIYISNVTTTSSAHYRPDNKIDSAIAYSFDGSSTEFAYGIHNAFNAQGALVHSYTIEGVPADTSIQQKYVYNAASTQLQSDTVLLSLGGTNVAIQAVTYHYNAGKLDSASFWNYDGMGLLLGSRTKMTYNTSGKLVTLKAYDYSVGEPVLSYSDSLGYTTGADYHTYLQEQYYDMDGLFTDGFREVKFVGTNGLPDSIKVYQKDDVLANYEYAGMLKTTYNSFDNPETFVVTTPMTGTTPIGTFSFYYETWEDATSIKPVAENKAFSVYPNPFTDNINIDWKGQQQSDVTVRLTNTIGQEIYKSSVHLSTGRNSIAMPALSSGNYILIIQDANGKSWSNKMVKK